MSSPNKQSKKTSFMEKVRQWRKENSDILDDEYADIVERLTQEDRKIFDIKVNTWD